MASSSKGKEKAQSYKAAFNKSPAEVRQEALKAVPEEKKLRPDAYKLATKTEHPKDFIYPYIPLSIKWITPVELKYANLTSQETAAFYLKDFADPYLYPKNYIFYYKILVATESVEIDSVNRTGGDVAYSKTFIKKVLFPDQWDGDLYRLKEIPKIYKNDRVLINYFDYMKAWEGALCYDNRQGKHSWFIQFRDCKHSTFPQWFINWFYDWGLHPITLPQNVRKIYEDFKEANPSMKFHSLMFAVYYQVPWIIKWEPTVMYRHIEKLSEAENPAKVPFIGRRILIKWWDKFDFFSQDSIFSKNGILQFEPPQIPPPVPPKQDLASVLKELLHNASKPELRKLIKEALGDSDDEGQGSTDTIMQDSQDPYM